MTEGTAVRTKRMGARFFKNPPQPHMCIRDSLKGCADPCYVNVLSWEKVASGMSSEGVPLYGGMKVCPPRTEKKKVAVFAVMANPEILKLHGKNARNLKERSWLIDILLDFVEKMNEGVVFNRLYTVLRDRDITGELKEIWMIVQSERAKAQQVTGSDELRRPVPQYAQYQEQQQRPHPMSQQHQHPAQQQQQQQQHQQQQQQQQALPHPQEEHVQLPPQYQPSGYYVPESNEKCESYEMSYRRQTQNIMITMKDRMYQSGPVGQQYHGNDGRVDRYIFRDPIVTPNPQVPQQNCLSYPAYQYPQLQRPMGLIPTVINCPHPPGPMTLIRPEQPIHYNKFYERVHRMPSLPQPQSPQFQMEHNSPANYYDAQNRPPPNMPIIFDACPWDLRNDRRRRDPIVAPPPPTSPPVQVTTNLESSEAHISTLQQPHFAVMTPLNANPSVNTPANSSANLPLKISSNTSWSREQNAKKTSTIGFPKNLAQTVDKNEVSRTDTDNMIVDNTNTVIDNTSEAKRRYEEAFDKFAVQMRAEIDQKRAKDKTLKIKLDARPASFGKRDFQFRGGEQRSLNGDVKSRQDSTTKERKIVDVEDRLKKLLIPEAERNGNGDKQRTDQTRLSKTTTSLKNTLKILAGGGSAEEIAIKKRSNGQVKTQNVKDNSDDVLQVYTILRKPEATTSQEDVTSDMSKLTIKDCRAAGEVGTVLS